jgi:uncharacterized phage protein (predicted DNA packaging)
MAITNGYCTLNELKASLRITDNVDDTLLELAIESASREIDSSCERTFYNMGTATRNFVAQDAYYTEIDDLISITHLKTDPDGDGSYTITWSASDYQLEPLNGFVSGIVSPSTGIRAKDTYLFPVEEGEALVEVRGVWGWSATPVAVKQATIIMASRLYKRNDSPLGVAGFGDIGVVRVAKLDPDVEALIMPFKKPRFA